MQSSVSLKVEFSYALLLKIKTIISLRKLLTRIGVQQFAGSLLWCVYICCVWKKRDQNVFL